MKRFFALSLPFALGFPLQGLAKALERPIPQPQTHEAELWFFIASLALIASLAAVQVLVNRR